MTELETTSDIQALLQAGDDALRNGDPLAARKHFRRATELEPENIAAWLGMARAVRPYKDKYNYLQRARDIDPAHTEVQEEIARVEREMAAGAVLAPPIKPQVDDPDDPDGPAAAEVEAVVCYRHPDRETGLLCVQCGRPICTECVRPAFVGQLCPECAKDRRPVNYQVTPRTLSTAGPMAVLFSVVFNTLAFYVLLVVPFIFLSFIAAFFVGPMIGELTLRILDRVTGNKRGKEMQMTVSISYGLGALAVAFVLGILSLPFFVWAPWALFVGVAIATLVGRLR
jgi:hypothetical protein